MFKSIRWTFLSWLALLLCLVVSGYGATLFYLLRRSKLQEIDAELEGAAHVLAERLRGRGPGRPPWMGGPRRPPRLPGDGSGGDERRRSFLDPFERGRDSRNSGSAGSSGEESSAPDESSRMRGRLPRRGGGWYRGAPRRPGFDRSFGELELPESLVRRYGEEGAGAPYFAIWRGDRLIRESNMPAAVPPPAALGTSEVSRVRQREGTLREAIVQGPRETLIVVGRSVHEELAYLNRLVGVLFGAGLGILVLALVGGWFLVKRAIRPLHQISATAESISAANLSRRIDIESTENELGRLAGVLNTTFDRLQEAFEQQARFTADASHELRTPVSVILAQTAMARRRERSAEEYREVIDACFVVGNRMKALVDGLLTLARTDAGDLRLEACEFDLAQLVEDCAGMLESLAAERGVALRLDLQPTTVTGDADRVVQVVSNLLTNAIRYNREGGHVRLTLEERGADAVLTVTDSGVGIPEEDLHRVFDRFYRGDPARSGKCGGAGLGLAISRAVVEAHGGTITCESVRREGSTFTVRLPRNPVESPPNLNSA